MADVEQPGGGADAMDFVLYLFVLGPMVEFCLKSKRVNKDNDRRRGIALAILVLATVAAIKVSIDLSTREPNYFELLEVHSAATGAEIKRAYKTKSLEMHPDKNPEDPNAQDRFTQMRAAYEVLNDARLRDIYNKFGEWGINEDKTNASGGLYVGMAVFYVIWVVISFLLTMGKPNTQARVWVFTGLVALAILEYQVRLAGADWLSAIMPRWTVSEKIEVLHKLFPPFMHGAKMIGQVIYVDPEAYNKALIESLHEKVNALAGMLRAVQVELDSTKGGRGGGSGGGGGGGGSSGGSGGGAAKRQAADAVTDAAAAGSEVFAAAGGSQGAAAARPLHPAVTGGQPGAAAAAGGAAQPGAGAAKTTSPQKLTNVIYFFAIYFAFQWIAGRSD